MIQVQDVTSRIFVWNVQLRWLDLGWNQFALYFISVLLESAYAIVHVELNLESLDIETKRGVLLHVIRILHEVLDFEGEFLDL